MTLKVLAAAMALVCVATALGSCAKEPSRVPESTPSAAPLGWLDLPRPGKVVGKTPVKGWALSLVGTITKVEVLLDGAPLDVHLDRGASAWACEKYPQAQECASASYSGELDFGSVAVGEHVLSWRITSSDGQMTEVARRTIQVE